MRKGSILDLFYYLKRLSPRQLIAYLKTLKACWSGALGNLWTLQVSSTISYSFKVAIRKEIRPKCLWCSTRKFSSPHRQAPGPKNPYDTPAQTEMQDSVTEAYPNHAGDTNGHRLTRAQSQPWTSSTHGCQSPQLCPGCQRCAQYFLSTQMPPRSGPLDILTSLSFRKNTMRQGNRLRKAR